METLFEEITKIKIKLTLPKITKIILSINNEVLHQTDKILGGMYTFVEKVEYDEDTDLIGLYLSYIKWNQNKINKAGFWYLDRGGDTCALCALYSYQCPQCQTCYLKCNEDSSPWRLTRYSGPDFHKPDKTKLVKQLELCLKERCDNYKGDRKEIVKKIKSALKYDASFVKVVKAKQVV
ncbi:MAG: hypothetical protein WC783_00255 [Candidatus Paceibacterota bacterium]|jgi:hypothetical protein